MADKGTFFESINLGTIFDEEFYKKVYGYSIYDKEFLKKVSGKLVEIGKKEYIQTYNEWLAKWKYEYIYGNENKEGLIKVSRWYSKICEEQYQALIRKSKKEREVKIDCNQKKKELLQQKKALLQMKLLQSIGN